MPISEIKPEHWPKMCRNLNENLKDALVTIEVMDTRGEKQTVIANEPLQEVIFDPNGDCSNKVVVRAGGRQSARHEIIEPIHVRIRYTEDGQFNPLEIEAESGLTFLRFNPSPRAAFREWLDRAA